MNDYRRREDKENEVKMQIELFLGIELLEKWQGFISHRPLIQFS